MFRLDVLQFQWTILALFSGIILVLGTVLTYTMIWRPRKDNKEAVAESEYQGVSTVRWYFSFMPWILTLVFVGVFVFGALYAVFMIQNPPNW